MLKHMALQSHPRTETASSGAQEGNLEKRKEIISSSCAVTVSQQTLFLLTCFFSTEVESYFQVNLFILYPVCPVKALGERGH